MKIIKKYKRNKLHFVSFMILSILLTMYFPLNGNVVKKKSPFTVLSHDNTNFPLVGKHRTTQCSECHIDGLVQNTPTNCEVCHWERRQEDRYKLQLGDHCGDCHTPFSWKKIKPNSWDHSVTTGFRLEGIHKTMDCFNCHKSETLRNISGECINCHREDYNEAESPDHNASGFPFDCTLCHSGMVTWENARFTHGNFSLEGAHKVLDCSDCHKGASYNGLSTDCFSCHSDDYNGVKDPDHRGSGFSTNCTDCHKNMLTWEGATISHSGFPLEGAHRTLDCRSCHKEGNYTKLPPNCSSCHISDYNNSENPDHGKAGYPTTCENCHFSNHSSWEQAVFNHQFYISSGPHSKHDCNECHLTSNYNEFFCTNCHIKSKMNDEHSDITGYVYNNQACYSCHPDGRED